MESSRSKKRETKEHITPRNEHDKNEQKLDKTIKDCPGYSGLENAGRQPMLHWEIAIDQFPIGSYSSCTDCRDIALSHKLSKQNGIVTSNGTEDASFVLFIPRQPYVLAPPS
ncbi:unnamed protein product [Schistosoma margrebowiei]|uniref:Uncharacterized protein n=1 Tax=Schistosoma margrebowiei TaxID=48269 RepID=A0A183MEX0_9TREM|nr:unnamed protein product [Schistosoma margrebowiei]